MKKKKFLHKKIYKYIQSLILFFLYIFTSSSFAISAKPVVTVVNFNPYIASQFGYVNTNLKNKVSYLAKNNTWIPLLVSNSGLAGRLAVGVQVNPFFAIEAGYLDVLGNLIYKGDINDDFESKINLEQNVYNILAKLNKPVSNYFEIYGKFGLDYVTTTSDLRFTKLSYPQYSLVINKARRKFAPEIGLGISYYFTSNVLFDLSWSHIHPMGKNKPGNLNFFTTGLIVYI